MKKYLLGIMAIILAVGFSAFTSTPVKPTKYQTNYYFFDVLGTYGGNSSFTNSQVSYIQFSSSTPQGACSGSTNKCKIGFNSGDVQETFPGSGLYELTTGTHTPAVIAWTRTNP